MVKIKHATWRDLKALRSIELVCFPKDAWPLIDLIGVLSLPNVIRLKAELDGEMVGFVAGDRKRPKGIAWIATICVLPRYRRQGIATALLHACEEKMTENMIRLCVRASNQAAIYMYERAGYINSDRMAAYYQDGEEAIVLEKRR